MGMACCVHLTGSFMLIRSLLLLLATLSLITDAHALTAQEAQAMAVGETDARIAAVDQAVLAADERTAAFQIGRAHV